MIHRACLGLSLKGVLGSSNYLIGISTRIVIGKKTVESGEIEVIDRKTKQKLWISNEECQFGYRGSIFEQEAKDKYIIIGVEFRLTKKNHILNTSYGAIQDSLKELNLEANQLPTIEQISKAIISIRESKLPNPKEIGNGGSFFKNPEIPSSQFEKLKEKFSDIVGYPISDEITKVPSTHEEVTNEV
jgi:UDP-N-acetylmuramate dehydrogenase